MIEIVIGIFAITIVFMIGVVYNVVVYGTFVEYWENCFSAGFGVALIIGAIVGFLWLTGDMLITVFN